MFMKAYLEGRIPRISVLEIKKR